MRVISGTARGTRLAALPGEEITRPTVDRVKEGMFSAVQFLLAGARVLDLFAGSGQLGIEALSRGASRAVFVDHRQDAAALVRENLRRTHFEDRGEVVCTDFTQYLARCRRKFRLIFLDPPYAEKSLETAIQRLSEIDILSDGGIIITERPLGKPLAEEFPGLTRSKDYHYGKTTITLLRKTGAGGGND